MRIRLLFILLPVLIAAGAVISSLGHTAFEAAPWDTVRHFQYPSGFRTDLAGNLVVVDKSGRRLSRLDKNGNLLWQIEGGQRTGGFYVADLKGVYPDGTILLLNSVRNRTSGVDERSDLLRVSPDGTIQPPIWSLDTSRLDPTAYNQLPYFHRLVDHKLYYLIGDSQGDTLLHEVDADTGRSRIIRRFAGLDAYQYVSTAYDPAHQKGWFLDNYGRIFEWPFGGGDPAMVFNNPLAAGRKIMVPSELYSRADGSFLLLDGKSEIVRIDPEGRPERVFGAAAAGGDLYLSGFAVQGDGRVVLANETKHTVLSWDPAQPRTVANVEAAHLTGPLLARQWLVWGMAVLGALAFAALIVLVYLRVMRRRTPLLFKQLGIFLPLTVLAVLSSSLWIYGDMMARYIRDAETRQIVWSQLGAGLISASDVDALDMGRSSQGEIMASEAFARLTAGLTRIVNENQDDWNASVYDYLYVPSGSDWYVFDQFTYFERYLAKPAMLEVYRSAKPALVRYSDAYSSWLSGFSPILRADGSVAALLEVTIDQNVFSEITASFQFSLLTFVMLIIVVLVVVTSVFTYLMLLSIRSLKQSAALISQGNYDVQVNIKSRDEIEDLGEVFNQMSREIRSYVERVVKLNQANAKFVPSQFLTFLGKDSITEIKLGDQVQREMTVLFSDIRSFTTLSERMTPEENFNFINRYLMEMGPVIRQQNGFIDKYIGDAIMALFPASVEDGLSAALAMYANLERLNRHSPLPGAASSPAGQMHIGIGLHTGMLMLGIIGEAERFDGTVISDTVNVASRLESLTKYYGVGILVSGQVLAHLAGKHFFESRLLDRVQVKGKTEALEIHEVLVPSLPGYAAKRDARAKFAQALRHYFAGDFIQAEILFTVLSQGCPEDGAIQVYLRRMKQHADQPAAGTWTGITLLDTK